MTVTQTTVPDRNPPRGVNLDPEQYVDTYLWLYAWIDESFMPVGINNYLQSEKGDQSKRAQKAHLDLKNALIATLKPKGGNLPPVFAFQNEEYVTASFWRVFNGKGAPDEIQSVLWLASAFKLLTSATVQKYADENLGMDCGGFVANYWGIGRPTTYDQAPFGSTGIKPRTFWETNKIRQRSLANQIRVGDAAIFFEDVKNDNPDQAANPIMDAAGKKIVGYDSSSGSQAFHIGLVDEVNLTGNGQQIILKIAESSGAKRDDGCTGVNVRSLGTLDAKAAKNLVYVMDGTNRVYFVGCDGQPSPYLPNKFGAA